MQCLPKEIEGIEYDKLEVNLSIVSTYDGEGNANPMASIRLVPAKIGDGEVLRAPDHAIGFRFGNFADADPRDVVCRNAIALALQEWVVSRGL